MSKRKTYDDDDGRTIADMSFVERRSLFVPRKPGDGGDIQKPAAGGGEDPYGKPGGSQGMMGEQLSFREKLSLILGALSAALMIGMVFIIGFAIVILIIILNGKA